MQKILHMIRAMRYRIESVFRPSQLLFGLSVLIVVPLSIIYTIASRSPYDFITHGGKVFFAFFALIVLWLTTLPIRFALERGLPIRAPSLSLLQILRALALALLVSLVMGLIYYSLGVAVLDAWAELRNWKALVAHKKFAIGIGAAVIVVIGLAFFWFRLRARFAYGISEALAGIAFAVYRLSSEPVSELPTNDDFYFAMLTAGVYLIVRGLDNMHVGWKDQKDPLAKLLLSIGSDTILVNPPPRRLKPKRITQIRHRRPRH